MNRHYEANTKAERTAKVGTTAFTGAIAGAAVGAVAGPVGVAAGIVVGGAAGAFTGLAVADDEERHQEHDEDLDEEIGVASGDLGAARSDSPPARIGAFSGGSAGVPASGEPAPSEGPIQDVDE